MNTIDWMQPNLQAVEIDLDSWHGLRYLPALFSRHDSVPGECAFLLELVSIQTAAFGSKAIRPPRPRSVLLIGMRRESNCIQA
jgi:hypothetical protein